ncbi:uncharacterized protein PG998_008376 [Apiospora kogelbergensis]|uniref:uncharacterized protein n=1 Tax=Apiospora kogelbergensis TaxID=1337665 RepID=UPI003130BF35
MTSPKMDSLSVELKIMVLKEMDAASILSLVSASPTFHRVFYAYHNEILKHSILYSSGISTEVLNDALAAGSLPYPANMDNLAKETITDKFAAEWAVKFWKCKRFVFAPSEDILTGNITFGCVVPGYPGIRFYLRHGAVVARLASYINDFIGDYAAKARCNPLEDFYVYNNVPKWAHPTLKSKDKISPIRSNQDIRLTKDELIKFQRAFFRFEFYSRVNAHLQADGEFDSEKNPLIQIPPQKQRK